MIAVIDPEGMIHESDEGNNRVSITIVASYAPVIGELSDIQIVIEEDTHKEDALPLISLISDGDTPLTELIITLIPDNDTVFFSLLS